MGIIIFMFRQSSRLNHCFLLLSRKALEHIISFLRLNAQILWLSRKIKIVEIQYIPTKIMFLLVRSEKQVPKQLIFKCVMDDIDIK